MNELGFSLFTESDHGDLSATVTSMCYVPRLLAGALSGALTGFFAVVGAFTGAVTGALAGRATDSGLLRGAGLGAVAGAVLSVEVLEASRAYWYSEHSSSWLSSSVVSFVTKRASARLQALRNMFSYVLFVQIEFLENFLNGRLVQDHGAPQLLNEHRRQLTISEMSYEELYAMFGPAVGGQEGASKACIEKLPSLVVTEHNKSDASGESICCTICLQDLLQGEIARHLPLCHHTFHLPCVDKWLLRQGSCPICRRYISDDVLCLLTGS